VQYEVRLSAGLTHPRDMQSQPPPSDGAANFLSTMFSMATMLPVLISTIRRLEDKVEINCLLHSCADALFSNVA